MKLRSDPVFETAFELLHASDQPLLDVGCGMGLLAGYLRERGYREPILGIDLDERKVDAARALAARSGYDNVEFEIGDARQLRLSFTGNVVVFDVLHYLPAVAQRALLKRVCECVAADGVVAIRDAPRERSLRYALTWAAEKFAQASSWNVRGGLDFPTPERVCAAFPEADFASDIRKLWGATPFNNHLFIFRPRSCGAVPAVESRSSIRSR